MKYRKLKRVLMLGLILGVIQVANIGYLNAKGHMVTAKTGMNEISASVDSSQDETTAKESGQLRWWKIAVIIEGVGLILVSIIIAFNYRANGRQNRENSNRLDAKSQWISKEIQGLKNSMSDMDRKIANLIKNSNEGKLIPTIPTTPPSKVPTDSQKHTTYYLHKLKGGIFKLAEDLSDCYYRVVELKGCSAEFLFIGEKSEYAIANRDEVFDYVCDIESSAKNAKQVEMVANGEIKMNEDGQWQVKTKAKVKLV